MYTLNADRSMFSMEMPEVTLLPDEPQDKPKATAADTIQVKYPVAKTVPDKYDELLRRYPIDLKTPENLSGDFVYDPLTNTYKINPKIGDMNIVTPLVLTPEEYMKYSFKKSMDAYFRKKYDESLEEDPKKENKDGLSGFDFKFDLGPAEKLFGPGGVQLSATGSVDIKMAITRTSTDNPTLTQSQRNRTAFDFDSQVQMNAAATIGDKINFDMNYNTQTTFDFDSKKLKLGYEGKEDEIIKVLEAGNVSMNTTNSLIRGGTALFGIKTELQFGKLNLSAVFSQQESQARTVSSKGNVQTVPFEITADAYEENRHFFLSQYFRDIYDQSMRSLPRIMSGIKIGRIEVWVTNKRANYDEARNIVAFSDLGETDHISESTGFIAPTGSQKIPYNKANSLYATITTTYPELRDISKVNQILAQTPLEGGQDYEKMESARKLSTSEYRLNADLGYISLTGMMLQPDEVLAVAFEYQYGGSSQIYQVGEFSTDNQEDVGGNLFLKLIKGTTMSPSAPFWDLMMKNVYSLGTTSLQQEKFKLNIKYQSDTTGTYLNYIPEGDIANQILLRVMNLDSLDTKGNPYPDGFYDFVEGYTVLAQQGRIIFPVVEPFGSHLRKKIGNDAIADKYVYQELYDSTLTVAKQIAEKNKFILVGEYKGSASSDISLGGANIARGSVRVTADGMTLTENVHYTVDYSTGNITIIDERFQNSNIQYSSEDQSNFAMQRKTMMGLNLSYQFNPKFNIGATVMNLSEMPLTMKVGMGEEAVNNTLYGFNMNYSTQSQWLTNLVDKLPFVEATAPSQFTMNGEFAHLIPGHYESRYGGNYSYIDDFEKSESSINLLSPYSWNLSGTPSAFEESRYVNDLRYGNNRSLLAWYYIDGMFKRSSSLTPSHIKNDNEMLSNHYMREIRETELFPNRQQAYGEQSSIQELNLAFYPKERGPYNLDADGVNPDGTLSDPQKRWGGIMRRIENGQTDFEAYNIEFIEFWMLDPFIYEPNSPGGDLYFNLGEVSEDILKDEKKFFENGLPLDTTDVSKIEYTVWGKVPKVQSLNYAFDNTNNARAIQDVGLNGLSSAEELNYPAYAEYLAQLRTKLDPAKYAEFEKDPAGDLYHHYRGSDYDQQQASILQRYKKYNGTEGNSAESESSGENYNTAAKTVPDVEDINQDNTLNENEKYFSYKVSLRPSDLVVGQNYIADKREATVRLKNGKEERVSWYQFKIPIREGESVGGIRDFKTIRFARMYLTNFADSVILRFGRLDLVRGDWRVYSQDLSNPNLPPSSNAAISMSTVNIEENSQKEPVNYILPPGVNRIMDPSQPQLRQQNEQALAVKVTDLAPGDARAIYKNTGIDTRQYKRLQMFSHAERFVNDLTNLQDDELSIFIRLGSDYKNNYYEYEIPLKITPPGQYADESSNREIVWPTANMFDFPFEILTNLKLKRNEEKRRADSGITFQTLYSSMDPNNQMNKISVIGNPSIAEIKVVMIGIRNNSRNTKSAEVWINELRLTDFNEDGGWAANGNLFLSLSDLGTFNFSGQKETAGFGGLDQGIMDRLMDDHHQYNLSASIDMGKFFPEKAKVSMPFYYSYTEDVVSPKYNPLDQDVLLKDALDAVETKAEKDSIRNFAQEKSSTRTIGVNSFKVDLRSKTPMPYDPANFTLGYVFSENKKQDASTTYERETDMKATLSYAYSPMIKPVEPFKNRIKSNSGAVKLLKDFGFNYLPSAFGFYSDITRNYYEVQLRDLNNPGENFIPASFREEFYWDRGANLQWDLTKNLKFSIQTGTQARIDAPHVQVNKNFNKDDYALWKDSVIQSIKDLGTPLNYEQKTNMSYEVPFRSIPALDFITAGLRYTGSYSWDKGVEIRSDDYQMGNTIRNERTLELSNFTINFLNLYNKSHFLSEVNKKYSFKRPSSQFAANVNQANRPQRRVTANAAKAAVDSVKVKKKAERKKFEEEILLNMDSSTVVQHQLGNKRLRVTARGENGKLYELKFKALDKNAIEIKNKDSVKLKLTISQLTPWEETTLYKMAQVVSRGLMMVRSAGISYSQTTSSMIPNFKPNVGDFLGQGNTPFGSAPGWDFALGFTDEGYLQKAESREWILKDTNYITPAMFNKSETFSFRATLEPFPGFRIELNANRVNTRGSEITFMTDGQLQRYSGSFNMTTIALGSAFENYSSRNNYRSKTFEQFLSNRQVIYDRLEQSMSGVSYPTASFTVPEYAGRPFDPANGDYTLNSPDVLIPAFLAAYTGQDAGGIGLTAFPSLSRLLPNWKITYEGLIQLEALSKHFKSFVISHEYNCRYLVGSYTSNASWVEASDGLGFIQSQTSGPIPSSPYEISAASITEAFNPLIGIDGTFRNNVTLKLGLRRTHNINLNVSSFQIVDITTNNLDIGLGYKLTEFNKVLKLKSTGGNNFSNDLTVNGTLSFQRSNNLIRKIQDGITQATSGEAQTMIRFSADYNMSRALTLQAFFDRQVSEPLVSSTAYPTSKSSFGINVNLKFMR
jgi:cell surface protein SprA